MKLGSDMKKVMLVMLIVVGMLTGCSPRTIQVEHKFDVPEELLHCKMYNMYNGYTTIYVMHCPNATTSTMVAGKHPVHSVMISE